VVGEVPLLVAVEVVDHSDDDDDGTAEAEEAHHLNRLHDV